ncbi:hypothetical protein C2845_PM10G05490 [Panicum miliaceum]|uniref:Uncharacterized protein n=1 Tax=Panicum miliaceum TaxID=4540 RepID=A0A3L6PBE1_PANMI|nr:hypothetical protein C2845_PM10G05490 [Panicum miliaceum]
MPPWFYSCTATSNQYSIRHQLQPPTNEWPQSLQPAPSKQLAVPRRAVFGVQASAASGHPGPAATFRPCGGAGAAGDAGGESRQRRSSRATAATRSSGHAAAAAFLGRARGARANATWRSSASAVVSVPSSRRISLPTASAQRPQTQRPRYSARTAAMYAGVHSSVNPQHSHLAFSTSMPLLTIRRSFPPLLSLQQQQTYSSLSYRSFSQTA